MNFVTEIIFVNFQTSAHMNLKLLFLLDINIVVLDNTFIYLIMNSKWFQSSFLRKKNHFISVELFIYDKEC